MTGDFYKYRKERGEWVPAGNTGLHFSRAIDARGGMGELIKKVKTYKVKSD